MKRPYVALVAAALLAPLAGARDWVGRPFPKPELEGFAHAPAKSLDDFVGRTVLVEFFAYW